MTNTKSFADFASWLQSHGYLSSGVVDLDKLVSGFLVDYPEVHTEIVIKHMDEVTVPAPGDAADNGWLAEAEAVNDLGDPWTLVSDIVGYLGGARPVRVDLEGDFYADPELDESELAEAYVTVYDYTRSVDTDGTVWITLHFEDFPSVSFPSNHALPLAR